MIAAEDRAVAETSFLVRLERWTGLPLWFYPLLVISATLLCAQGYPSSFFKAGYFQLAMLPLLFLFLALRPRDRIFRLPLVDFIECSALLCIVVIATISFLQLDITDGENVKPWFFAYVLPVMLYFTVRGLTVSSGVLYKLISIYVISGALLFLNGLIVFLQDFRPLTLQVMLFARYDILRIARYQLVTFGFTTGTAAVLAIFFPLCVFFLTYGKPGKWMRIVLIATIGLLLPHIVINQVRTLVFVLLLMFFMMLLRRRPWLAIATVLLLVAGAGTLATAPGPARSLVNRFTEAVTLNSQMDDSVNGRIYSVEFGWRQMAHNWQFGIGPGRSAVTNPLTAAHEFLVNQGAENGVLAFILWAMLFAIWSSRFLYLFFIRKETGWRIILLSGPFFYIVFAVLSNASLANGAVTAWAGSVMFLMALASVAPNDLPDESGADSYGRQLDYAGR